MKIKDLKGMLSGGTEPQQRDRFKTKVKSLAKILAEKNLHHAKAYGA